MKAVFFDRDGTISEEVNYLTKIEQIKIYEGVVESLALLKSNGYLNIVITNQSAVARGYLTIPELEKINAQYKSILTYEGKPLIDEIFYSPYHPEGVISKFCLISDDRKPGTGLIEKAVRKFSISISDSYFIGDSLTDMQCAERAGLKKILVKTGYGIRDYGKIIENHISLDYYANDINSAVEHIINNDIRSI